MSRKERVLKKRYAIFCEGDTEYNYIDKMRKNQGVELVLKPINMHGGGYSNFLRHIKKEAQSNYLAKFIIVDADRIKTIPGEQENFIVNVWKFKDIAAFKGNEDVYEFLNSGNRSYGNLLDVIRMQDKLVSNKYEIKKKTFDIIIKQTDYDQDALDKKNTNIEEFVDVIDW